MLVPTRCGSLGCEGRLRGTWRVGRVRGFARRRKARRAAAAQGLSAGPRRARAERARTRRHWGRNARFPALGPMSPNAGVFKRVAPARHRCRCAACPASQRASEPRERKSAARPTVAQRAARGVCDRAQRRRTSRAAARGAGKAGGATRTQMACTAQPQDRYRFRGFVGRGRGASPELRAAARRH